MTIGGIKKRGLLVTSTDNFFGQATRNGGTLRQEGIFLVLFLAIYGRLGD